MSARLLTVEQLAERLQVGRTTAYELANRIPGRVYLGRLIRIPEAALESWLERGGDQWQDGCGSTDAARFGGAGSTTTAAPGSARPHTKAIERWLERLQPGSNGSTSPRRKGRPRSGG